MSRQRDHAPELAVAIRGQARHRLQIDSRHVAILETRPVQALVEPAAHSAKVQLGVRQQLQLDVNAA